MPSDASAARTIILEYEARLNSAGADRTRVKYELYGELKSKGLDEAAELLMTFDVVTRASSGNSVNRQPPPTSRKAKKLWITAAICTLLILLGIRLAPYLYTLSVNHFSPVVVPNSHFVGEHGRNKKLLIFVHGVIGDMDNTWVNPETHASWPELIRGGPGLSDFDVFVYGYASPKAGDASTVEQISVRFLQQLKDFGFFDNYREVSFIAHSMGGIVTKRTLNMLNTQADSSILQKVHTVIYISVPSNGSNLAALTSWISDNPQFKSMSPKAASDYLHSVEGGWANLLRQRSSSLPFPRTYSAYETLPTGPVQVVPELYTSELSDGRVIGFDYNHIDIVKPKDRDAEVYRWVQSRLLERGLVASTREENSVAAPVQGAVSHPPEINKAYTDEVGSAKESLPQTVHIENTTWRGSSGAEVTFEPGGKVIFSDSSAATGNWELKGNDLRFDRDGLINFDMHISGDRMVGESYRKNDPNQRGGSSLRRVR